MTITGNARDVENAKGAGNAKEAMHAQAHEPTQVSVEVRTQLEALGFTTEEVLDANPSDAAMSISLYTRLRESLAEMERLASALDAYLLSPHEAAPPLDERNEHSALR